jgi:pimeloyl-ACP methyl ester carboxylesterase
MSDTLTRRAAFALPLLALAGPSLAAVTPPQQPPDGPGGARTLYPRADRHDFGKGAQAAAVFTPPGCPSAPVVVFLHGWGATDPSFYGAWIEHICRRGRIVICPAYQDSLITPPAQFAANAAAAIKAAMGRLQTGAFGTLPEHRGAYLGHSMGGALAARLACDAAEDAGLPRAMAVMCVEPGVGQTPGGEQVLGDLSRLQTGTLLITVVGDRDTRAGDRDAQRIWLETVRVRPFDKSYVVMNSDDHGSPALVADHAAPGAATPGATLGLLGDVFDGPVGKLVRARRAARQAAQPSGSPAETIGKLDALDWYGTWKLFDALTDAAFYDLNRGYALGGGSDETFMGIWSDGVPVRRMSVLIPR